MINNNDSIVLQRKLYFKDISVTADFKIDKKWEFGNYILRAYTKHMGNVSSDFYFQKGITDTEIPVYHLSLFEVD